MDSPNLVAPGVKSFMDFALKNCRQMKDTYMTVVVNVTLTVVLAAVVGGFLYYKYKGKPTPAEVEDRKRRGQEYVMRKLGGNVATRLMTESRSANELTGLPIWEKSLLIPGVVSSASM